MLVPVTGHQIPRIPSNRLVFIELTQAKRVAKLVKTYSGIRKYL